MRVRGVASAAALWLCLAPPPGAAVEEAVAWPEEGLEVGVQAAGAWIAGVERTVDVRVHQAPTALSLRAAPGAEVAVEIARDDRLLVRVSARTDATGRASLSVPVPSALGPATVVVRARLAAEGGEVERGVQIEDGRVAEVRTDRRLYRSGDAVGLRALVARRTDLRPVEGAPVTLAVRAPGGESVLEEETRTSEFGVVHGSLALGPRARTGTYRVVAEAGGAQLGSATFLVAHRALPRFRVEAEPEHGWVRPGAKISLRVRATFFHGRPVRDARVRVLAGGREVATATLGADGTAAVPIVAPPESGRWPLRVDVRASEGTVASADAAVGVDAEPTSVSRRDTPGSSPDRRAARRSRRSRPRRAGGSRARASP